MEPDAPTLILVKLAMPEIVPGVPAANWVLSGRGRASCSLLAARWAGYNPAQIVTSTEPKAEETGLSIAAALGVPVSAAPGLQEHDQGDTPILEPERWRSLVAAFFARPDGHVFGRESATAAGERFAGAVAAVPDAYPAGNTAIVAHGRVISLLVARTNPVDPFALWGRLGLPSFVVLSVPDLDLVKVVERVD